MKSNRLLYLYLILSVVVTVFIFGQSLRGPEASNASSGAIVEIVEPILEDIVGKEDLNVNFLVRKAAHLTEFCVLGVCTMSLSMQLRKRFSSSFVGFTFFYSLLVGVADEFLQSFSGRSSMVSDVLIDFTGAMIGFGLVTAVGWLSRKKDGNNENKLHRRGVSK